MRFVLSLVVVAAAASAAYAQNQKTNSGGLQGSFGSSNSATGGLRGVYGPPGSSAGQLPESMRLRGRLLRRPSRRG